MEELHAIPTLVPVCIPNLLPQQTSNPSCRISFQVLFEGISMASLKIVLHETNLTVTVKCDYDMV